VLITDGPPSPSKPRAILAAISVAAGRVARFRVALCRKYQHLCACPRSRRPRAAPPQPYRCHIDLARAISVSHRYGWRARPQSRIRRICDGMPAFQARLDPHWPSRPPSTSKPRAIWPRFALWQRRKLQPNRWKPPRASRWHHPQRRSVCPVRRSRSMTPSNGEISDMCRAVSRWGMAAAGEGRGGRGSRQAGRPARAAGAGRAASQG
jgi:hypothetical protein